MEETLEKIKNCDDFDLFAWKQDMDDFYNQEGYCYDEDAYRAIVSEIERREKRKKYVTSTLSAKAHEVLSGLIQEGYSNQELKLFLEFLETELKSVTEEKSNNRSK